MTDLDKKPSAKDKVERLLQIAGGRVHALMTSGKADASEVVKKRALHFLDTVAEAIINDLPSSTSEYEVESFITRLNTLEAKLAASNFLFLK